MSSSERGAVSEITLTPTIDKALDYQQYLEKTSQRNSLVRHESQREHSPIDSAPPAENDAITETSPVPLGEIEIRPEAATATANEKIRPARAHRYRRGRKEREKRHNRVEAAEDAHEYPGPLALFLLTFGICLSVFLVSLDRTIVATVRVPRSMQDKLISTDDLFVKAIPRITNDFHSYDDVGWYGSAYLVTAGALQPIYGRIFILFNIKWSFLCALGIFELGSLVCGIAPNSVALIIGRAIAGWGSAGLLTGSFVVVAHAVPLQRRPVFTAAVGLMFG